MASVSRGDLVQTVHAAGAVVTSTQTKLGFKTAGRIAAIRVAVGDAINKGQVLAELDSTDATVALHQAQAASQVAKAGVSMAQAKSNQVVAGARPESIAQATAVANIARQKLQDMLDGGRPEQVAQAQADLDAAQQKLQLTLGGARQEQIQQAQAALQQAQAKLQALRDGPRPEQLAVLQKQVETAKNALYAAQVTRDGDCNPRNPDYQCGAGQAQVAAAETAVGTAQKQFVLATAPPTATDLQQAQAVVDQAQAQVNILLANTPQDVQAARDAVTRAEQGLALAKNPSTAPQVQQAREAVSQADAAAQLAARPYTDADLEAAQAGVDQAQAQAAQADAALEAAQVNLNSLQMTAPADGKVLQINNSVGEIVPAGATAIVLGVGGLVVNVGLPEASFAKVRSGQAAEVTFDSAPGKVFDGMVTDLPQAATPMQNLVSYVAAVKLEHPDDSVHIGASAGVTIYTVRKQGVLLLPIGALETSQGKPAVTTIGPDGQAASTEVELGLADDQHVEVLSGLREGQRVQIARAGDATSIGAKS